MDARGYVPAGYYGLNEYVLSTGGYESVGVELVGLSIALDSAGVWAVANQAVYVPISVNTPITVKKMAWLNGAISSGNIDVGIYDAAGTRLVSSGSTAQGTISVVQEVDITDTLLIRGRYYFALAMDNITGTVARGAPVIAACSGMGVLAEASAFVLPATATFVAPISAIVPWIVASRGTILA